MVVAETKVLESGQGFWPIKPRFPQQLARRVYPSTATVRLFGKCRQISILALSNITAIHIGVPGFGLPEQAPLIGSLFTAAARRPPRAPSSTAQGGRAKGGACGQSDTVQHLIRVRKNRDRLEIRRAAQSALFPLLCKGWGKRRLIAVIARGTPPGTGTPRRILYRIRGSEPDDPTQTDPHPQADGVLAGSSALLSFFFFPPPGAACDRPLIWILRPAGFW